MTGARPITKGVHACTFEPLCLYLTTMRCHAMSIQNKMRTQSSLNCSIFVVLRRRVRADARLQGSDIAASLI